MELELCDDVLNALLGFEGKYIHKIVQQGVVQFKLSTEVQKPLSDLVERILPTCNHYTFITQYIQKYSQYEHGMVAQAFTAALDALMKEYGILIGKLDDQLGSPDFSLAKLMFHLQATMHNLSVVYDVVHSAHQYSLLGGGLLRHLSKTMTEKSGDLQTHALLHYALQKACAPYFDMLEEWLYNGCIKDPKGEFLIEQHDILKDRIATEFLDQYWSKKFTPREEMFTPFVSPYSRMILLTGKYLNVIRECGKPIENPHRAKFVFSERESDYGDKIEKAYNWACQKLLDVICKDEQLFERLESIKHYFFLDQGDFFVHFVDISEEELMKSAKDVNHTKLESLLELSVRSTTCNNDPFKDDLTFEVQGLSLMNILTRINRASHLTTHILHSVSGTTTTTNARDSAGTPTSFTTQIIHNQPNAGPQAPMQVFDAFTFSYKLTFPISLVVNKAAITKYQLLFRHLFKCKWVERQLSNTWNLQFRHSFDRKMFAQMYSLRQRMMHFLQNFEYYMVNEVIDFNWNNMIAKMKAAKNIDAIIDIHTDFLDTCLSSSMLTNSKLFKTLTELIASCTLFASYYRELAASHGGAMLGSSSLSAGLNHTDEAVKGFQQKFDAGFNSLLTQLSGSSIDKYLVNLLQRLDFNDYYGTQNEKITAMNISK